MCIYIHVSCMYIHTFLVASESIYWYLLHDIKPYISFSYTISFKCHFPYISIICQTLALIQIAITDLHQRRRLHHRQGMAFAHDAMHLWPETPTMGWPYDPSILGFTTIEKPMRILKDKVVLWVDCMKHKIDYGMDYIYILLFFSDDNNCTVSVKSNCYLIILYTSTTMYSNCN
jgi:hypothetical protein